MTETHLTPIYLGGAGGGVAGETRRTPSSAAASAPQRIPDRIGAYRIVGELGEGGMGVVYLAEQTEPIRRTVAIKVIKPTS